VWGVSARFRLQILVIPRCEQSFGTPQALGLVEVENVEALIHPLDLFPPRRLGHEQARPRVARPEGEVARAELLGARDGHEAGLDGAEHHLVPLRPLADEDEHAVAAREPAAAKQRRPAGGAARHLGERQLAPASLAVDKEHARRSRSAASRLTASRAKLNRSGTSQFMPSAHRRGRVRRSRVRAS
jgi:hypothetical protein